MAKVAQHIGRLLHRGKKVPDDPTGMLTDEIGKSRPNLKTCRWLIECGAKLEEEVNGFVPLIRAVYKDAKLVRVLIDGGANVHCMDDRGNTPMMHVAGHDDPAEQIKVAQVLKAAGADIHAVNEHGGTALTMAFINCSIDMAKWLIGHGADMAPVLERGAGIFEEHPAGQEIKSQLHQMIDVAEQARKESAEAARRLEKHLRKHFDSGMATAEKVPAAPRTSVMRRRRM